MNDMTEKIHHNRRLSFIMKILILMMAALMVIHFEKVLGILRRASNIIMPFILGLSMAYITNLIMAPIEGLIFSKSQNKIINKLSRPLSIVITLLIVLGIIALVLYLIIPQLYHSVNVIGKALPVLAENLQTWFLEVTKDMEWTEGLRENIENMNINWSQFASRAAEFLRSG